MRRRMKGFRFGKSVVGKRKTTTRVRGHYRRTPSGGRTYVNTHKRRVMKNQYRSFRYITNSSPLSIKPRLVQRAGNSIFTTLSMAFPQHLPIIEVGRFAFNNRDNLYSLFKTIFSNKSDKEKIEHITSEIENGVKKELATEFSKKASSTISEMIESQIGFTKVLQTLNKGFTDRDARTVRTFFDSTLEKLILDSTKSVIGLG